MHRDEWVKKTRKPHRCEWCSTRINAGSAALYYATTCDGDFFAGHMHPECAAACVCVVRANHGYYELTGDDTRGRTDGESGPPQFLDTYRGENFEEYRFEPETKEQKR